MAGTTTHVTALTSALTGTDCKVLIAMLMLQRSVSATTLGSIIGRSRQATATALDHLANLGLVQDHGAANGGKWMLTTQAEQFILGKSQPTLNADERAPLSVKSFNTGTSGGGINMITDTQTLVVATATSGGVKKVNTEKAQAAIDFLVEHNCDACRAAEATQKALDAGWSEEQCLDCVRKWYAYAHSPAGHWINSPIGYAAYALEARRRPPAPKKSKDDQKSPYLNGQYADIVQH